jgi:hypothetical protein
MFFSAYGNDHLTFRRASFSIKLATDFFFFFQEHNIIIIHSPYNLKNFYTWSLRLLYVEIALTKPLGPYS